LKDQARPWRKLIGQVFLGSEDFVSHMQELPGDKQKIKEIPRPQRYPGRPSLDRLFANIGTETRQKRNKQVVEAHFTHGYTLKEIADYLNIHYTTVTTVSKIVSGTRKN
jgi:putative transposase